MSTDTFATNQKMTQFDEHQEIWLFGYGSLIFKPDFPFLQRQPASIRNWARRFWQESHDHRGTEELPGRVVTLVPVPGATCGGMAYLVTPEVFEHLDHREKNGYLRITSDVYFDNGQTVDGQVYIANPDNAAFAGPAPEDVIARHIVSAHGPSGSNSEYLLNLANSLRELGQQDPHVFALEKQVLRMQAA